MQTRGRKGVGLGTCTEKDVRGYPPEHASECCLDACGYTGVVQVKAHCNFGCHHSGVAGTRPECTTPLILSDKMCGSTSAGGYSFSARTGRISQ